MKAFGQGCEAEQANRIGNVDQGERAGVTAGRTWMVYSFNTGYSRKQVNRAEFIRVELYWLFRAFRPRYGILLLCIRGISCFYRVENKLGL